MDKQAAINLVQSLTVSDVRQAYSGKPGCACGCNGKYYCTPEAPEAKEDSDQIDIKQCNRVLNQVKRAVNGGDPFIEDLNAGPEIGWNVADDLQYVTAQVSETRVYTVYLMSGTRRANGVEKRVRPVSKRKTDVELVQELRLFNHHEAAKRLEEMLEIRDLYRKLTGMKVAPAKG